jgi:uncharacterized membrane protein YoaK (UPF0700 family)
MITEGMTTMMTDMSVGLQTRSWASAVPQICFALASVTAVIGVSLGIYMGIAHDFTLTPVHAHVNLLGWVSLFLMGLYYRFHEQALGRAAAAQIAVYVTGYITMTSGMAGMFLGDRDEFFVWTVAGSILVWLGFAIFAAIVIAASVKINRERIARRA